MRSRMQGKQYIFASEQGCLSRHAYRSGVNGMSDLQTAAMFQADDSYAGSETFNRVKAAVKAVFGCDNVLPAHQGRACENILAEAYVKPGMVAIMNYHLPRPRPISRVWAAR